jgi:hypothetical protein
MPISSYRVTHLIAASHQSTRMRKARFLLLGMIASEDFVC